MTRKQLLTTLCMTIALATATISHADDLNTLNPELAEQKLAMETRHVQQLESLKQAGFAEEEVNRMQHLLLHKIELVRSGKVPASHQLVAKKVAATAADMHAMSASQQLPREELEHIQHVMLHKLDHMKDVAYFTAF